MLMTVSSLDDAKKINAVIARLTKKFDLIIEDIRMIILMYLLTI